MYFCKLEGLAVKQRKEILARVEELVLADPADLPEEHRRLPNADSQELGEGPTGDCRTWLKSMDSALAAANHV